MRNTAAKAHYTLVKSKYIKEIWPCADVTASGISVTADFIKIVLRNAAAQVHYTVVKSKYIKEIWPCTDVTTGGSSVKVDYIKSVLRYIGV